MAKITAVGLTMALIFIATEVTLRKSEPPTEEARAISALRAVAAAQLTYAALNGGYATSLRTLAEPCPGGGQPFIAPDFLSPDLSSDQAVRHNYEIRLQVDAHALIGPVDCHGNPTARTYSATAVSLRRGGTPLRAFAVYQGHIWYDVSGAAPKPPFSETATLKRLR